MRPSDLEDTLEHILRRLLENGGLPIDGPEITLDYADKVGILEVSIEHWDGSRLEVTITVAGPANFPTWPSYSIHFMDSNKVCVFRYDNVPSHPGLLHFPHHKHTGTTEIAEGCPQPSVNQIVREIAEYLDRKKAQGSTA